MQGVIRDNAESALGDLAGYSFDAAIVDIGLPEMRGDVFAKECRRLYPGMPVVLATGMHQAQLITIFETDLRVCIVKKPHDFSEVRACLERLGLAFDRGQRDTQQPP